MQAQKKETRIVDAFIAEIDQEAPATRRLLEIVPDDKLEWRPHPKAMSLGQLAMHVAQTQGGVAEGTNADDAERPVFIHEEAKSRADIINAFESGTKKAKEILAATTDEKALSEWRIMDGEKVLMAMPRVAFWRSIMLNHVYHHRGQLSTYLRTLDIPLPSIYGPSADTNPFE
ncbi:MAG: DinB family protein [Pyrinomonadaceae bacterium]